MNTPIFCAALVKPGSDLARQIGNDLPVWGIYEHCPATCTRELRFGDGSWVAITPATFHDLHLLPAIGDAELSHFFEH